MGKDFGDRVSLLLEQQDISQREIAGILGITEATMSRYIKGEREPKPETIANIATILKATSDYLLGIEDSSEPEKMGYPRIRRLIARNADGMTDDEKKVLISDILGHMGNKGEM